MDLDAANAILLRRKRALIVSAGPHEPAPEVLATALKHLESVGHTASEALAARFATLSPTELARLVAHARSVLAEELGAHRAHTPMYANFPQEVMSLSKAALYLNQLLHYVGDAIGLRMLPLTEDPETRAALPEPPPLTPIVLGTLDDLLELARDLLRAPTSLSPTDRADVQCCLEAWAEDPGLVLPDAIPQKETLAFATGVLLACSEEAALALAAQHRTATDVLRLAVALSDGDVSLAAPTRFRSFRRPERRLLLALLDRIDAPAEDMQRRPEAFKRLGERLHPGAHRARYPRAATAFDALRRNVRVRTFHSRVEAALEAGAIDEAVALLRTRPGELARRLDVLLRRADHPLAVVEAFSQAADSVSTPVLLQVLAHFLARNEPQELRAFFPKGNVARVVTVPHRLPVLPEAARDGVVRQCRRALVARFAERASLGPTWVDPELRHYLVPSSQRSASRSLRTLVRGSRVALPPTGDTLRFFLWWKEGVVDGKATGRVDIDLSAVLYDEQWRYKEHISYTNLKSDRYRAYHSGDITSAPDGAAEFIDLDMPSVVRAGGRYVVMCVLSFTRQHFVALPECFAGWMLRSEPGSGEIFEPRTVQDRVDLTTEQRINVPVVLDVVERRMVWTDLGLAGNPRWQANIEGNDRGIAHMARAITALVKPTLYELFSLHAEARGSLVDDPAEAQTVFGLRDGTTPFDIETILGRYL